MKILVTGGAGFIASHVVDRYIEAGHEVSVIDDLSTGRRSNVNPRAVFYQMDIRSPEIGEVIAKEKPEVINHHAAQMNIRCSMEDPIFDAEVNILGSLNLLKAAIQNSIRRFIYSSAGGAVYGEPVYLPCDESHPVQPICPHGASKHSIEHYLDLFHANYGLEYIVLRYPNVYGPRQNPNGTGGVVAIFTGQMLCNQPVTIFGDGKQERDFVYMSDCAEANLLALDSRKPTAIYNLGTGHGTSINDIFNCLKELTGYRGGPIHGPAKVGEIRRIYLNAERARRELGWGCQTSLEQGLQQTVMYFKECEFA